LQTLVIEAGETILPGRDYVEHVPVWEMKFRGLRDRQYEKLHRPVQRHIGDEWNAKFFVDDLKNPYTTPPDQPYLFLRGPACRWSLSHVGATELPLERHRF
jgi:hypothetical protein